MGKICIAVIVSDHVHFCRGFLSFNKLNPNCFKIATSICELQGLAIGTPIIVTAHSNSDRYYEMKDMINNRFTSVRFMDY